MKRDDLKIRQIKDEQVFNNITTAQAGLMGSGGSEGCGCGCGGRMNVSKVISLDTNVDLEGYNWVLTGFANVYAIVNSKPAFGDEMEYSMTVNVTTSTQLTGESSCTTNSEGEKIYTGGNSVIATGGISNSAGGTSVYLSGTIGTGRFTASKSKYDKNGKLLSSETLLDKMADIELSLTIDYDKNNDTLNEREVKITLIALTS